MSFETNVFINCPFDVKYIDDLLKPMIYIILRNGLNPRLSLEISDSGQVRLEKITKIISTCKYSIHDLSIVKSKKANEFARMNMPFELGIDYGLRNSGMSLLNTKRFLILEATKYDYQKALSDINGFDIKVHSNDTQGIFDCLYTWLSETLKLHKQNPPLKTFYDFIDFNAKEMAPIKSELKDKGIIFLYITNDSSPEKAYRIMTPGIKGEHYRLTADEYNVLVKRFQINGIPHYTIANKKGVVVENGSHSIDTEKLKEKLMQMAKE